MSDPSGAAGSARDTRGRVLAAIRVASQAPSVDELADRLGLHPNTVRSHVEALVAQGMVRRERRPTGGRGRPHTVFRWTPEAARAGDRNYELLAGVLMRQLVDTSPDAVAAARQAGRGWGRDVIAGSHGEGPGPPDSPVGIVLGVLDALGFEPAPNPGGRAGEVVLHNCPFRELVDRYADVACELHLGLIEGVLTRARAGAPTPRPALVPFAAPGRCLVDVSPGQG